MFNFNSSNFLPRFPVTSAKPNRFSHSVTSVSLAMVLGLAGLSWMGSNVLAPQIAQAATARLNVELNRQQGETYQTMLRRAEAVARAAAQRAFDGDLLVTDVAITILGQNEGAIAPILRLSVSRQSWREQPDPQLWATYFPNVESLLKFENVAINGENTQADQEGENNDSTNTPISQPLPRPPSSPSNTNSPNSQPRPTTTTGNTDLVPPGSNNQPNNPDTVNPDSRSIPDFPSTTNNNP